MPKSKQIPIPAGWSTEAPTEEGYWWFYGEDAFGSMGGHFRGTVAPTIDMYMVRVTEISNGFMFVNNGHYMAQHAFDPSNPDMREGWCGLWKKADVPEAPDAAVQELCSKLVAEVAKQEAKR